MPTPIVCALVLGRSWAWCRPRSRWEAGCGIIGTRPALAAHAVLAAGGLGSCLALSGVRVERRRASSAGSGPFGAGGGRAGDAPDRPGYRGDGLSCYRLTERPGRSRFTRPWCGPVIRPMERSCWRRPSCSTCGRFVSLAGSASRRSRARGRDRRGRLEPAALELGGRGLKSMASIEQPLLAASASETTCWPRSAAALAAYLSLTKPRLVLLVLVTVAVGFFLGARGESRPGDDSCRWRRRWSGPRWWPGARRAQPVARARPRRPDAADGQPGASQRPAGAVGSRGLRRFARRCWARRSCSWGRTCWRPRSRS